MGFLQQLLREHEASQLKPHPCGTSTLYGAHSRATYSGDTAPRRFPLYRRIPREPGGPSPVVKAKEIDPGLASSPGNLPEEFFREAQSRRGPGAGPPQRRVGAHATAPTTTPSNRSEGSATAQPPTWTPLEPSRRVSSSHGSCLRNSRSCSRLGLTTGRPRSSLRLGNPPVCRTGSSSSRALSLGGGAERSSSAAARTAASASSAAAATADADAKVTKDLADVAELLQRVRRASAKLRNGAAPGSGLPEGCPEARPLVAPGPPGPPMGGASGKYSQPLKRSPYGSLEGLRRYMRRGSSNSSNSWQHQQLPRAAGLPYHPMLTETGLAATCGIGASHQATLQHQHLSPGNISPGFGAQRQSRAPPQGPAPCAPAQYVRRESSSRLYAPRPDLPRHQCPTHPSLQEQGESQQRQLQQQARVPLLPVNSLVAPGRPKSNYKDSSNELTSALPQQQGRHEQRQHQPQQILDVPIVKPRGNPLGTPRKPIDGSLRSGIQETEFQQVSLASVLSSGGAGSALDQLLYSSSSAPATPATGDNATSSPASRATSPRANPTVGHSPEAASGQVHLQYEQQQQHQDDERDEEQRKRVRSPLTLRSSQETPPAGGEEEATCRPGEFPSQEGAEYEWSVTSFSGPSAAPARATAVGEGPPSGGGHPSVESWGGILPECRAEKGPCEEWSHTGSEKHSMHDVRLQLSCLHQEVLSMWQQKSAWPQQQQSQQHQLRRPSRGGHQRAQHPSCPRGAAGDSWKKQTTLSGEHLSLLSAAAAAAYSRNGWDGGFSVLESAADGEAPLSAGGLLARVCTDEQHRSKQQQLTPFLLPYGQGHTAERARRRLSKKAEGGQLSQQQQQQSQYQHQQGPQQQRCIATAGTASSPKEVVEGPLGLQGAAQQLQQLQQELQRVRSRQSVLEEERAVERPMRAESSPQLSPAQELGDSQRQQEALLSPLQGTAKNSEVYTA